MNKKMNNKGFSLVELIIVIAIMAILVGVLAPQYIKYVEKSRKSTDIQTLDSMKQALDTITKDPTYATEIAKLNGKPIEITFEKKGATYEFNGASSVEDEFIETIGKATSIKGKSKACDGIKIIYDSTTDTVYYTVKNGNTTDISALDDSGNVESSVLMGKESDK